MSRKYVNIDRLKENLSHWNTLWITLFTIGMGLFLCGTPKALDDAWYLIEFRNWFKAQNIDLIEKGGNIFKAGIPWREYLDMLQLHYNYDNIRLTNQVGTFLLLFPKWVGSGLLTLLLAWSVIAGVSLTGYDWRKSAATPMMIFLTTFFLPWLDNFLSFIFQINYIFPTWLSLMLLRWLIKPHRGFASCLTALLFGLLVGVSHEGFSAPVACGLGALFCLYKSWRRPDVTCSIIGLLIGVAILLCIPATELYFDYIDRNRLPYIAILRTLFPIFNIAGPVFLLIWIIAVIGRGRKKFLSDSIVTFAVVSAISLLVICLRSQPGLHAIFWMDFISFVGLIRIIRLQRGTIFNRRDWKYILFTTLMLLPTYAHLATVDYYSLQLRRISHDAQVNYLRTGEKFFFSEMYINRNISPLALKRPSNTYPFVMLMMHPGFLRGKNLGFGESGQRWDPIRIIPKELEYVSAPNDTTAIGQPKIYIKDGFHYSHATPRLIELARSLAWVGLFEQPSDNIADYPDTTGYVINSLPLPFISKADGRQYIWYYYALPTYKTYFDTIRPVAIREY